MQILLKKEPEISVICACHNHGKYVGEMLDSVLNQTFSGFEVIIVNDGSTDDTAEILHKISHEKVKVIHSARKGPAAARNFAIENAGAPVIMNLDADDKIAPSLLEKAYNIFHTHPDAGIVYCDAECFGARTGKFEIGEYSLENMLYDNRINSQAFFRKEDWRTIGGFSSDFIYGLEDWDFWLSIIELERKVYHIAEKLSYYRTYTDSKQSRSGKRKSNRVQSSLSILWIFNTHRALYLKYPEILQYFSELENRFNNENLLIRQIRNLYFNFRQMVNQ